MSKKAKIISSILLTVISLCIIFSINRFYLSYSFVFQSIQFDAIVLVYIFVLYKASSFLFNTLSNKKWGLSVLSSVIFIVIFAIGYFGVTIITSTSEGPCGISGRSGPCSDFPISPCPTGDNKAETYLPCS